MGTHSWMSGSDITSDTAFRKWVQGIHDGFLAAGWVQSSDTGQANIATIAVPSTSNTAAGYEVWRLDDAQQATAPIYVKFEFGRGGSPGNNTPGIWFTVGQSTNGAGTLGNLLLARQQIYTSSTAQIVTENPGYASGDGHSLNLLPWPTAATACSFSLHIDRSRDTSGAPTTSGFMVALACSATNTFSVVGNGGVIGSAKHAASQVAPVNVPTTINGVTNSVTSTLSEDGVTAPVLPVPCLAPGVTPWVSSAVVVVHPGDAGTTSVIQAATINGETHIFRAFPLTSNAGGIVMFTPGSSTRAFFAILWE